MKRIFAVLAVAVVMAAMMAVTAGVALAATDQSCANWDERNFRAHDRLFDGKESNGDIQSHNNVHKNFDNVCV
jgi:hypothetical protein